MTTNFFVVRTAEEGALHGAIAKGMHRHDFSARLANEGSEGIATAPETFGAFWPSELARFAPVIKSARIGSL